MVDSPYHGHLLVLYRKVYQSHCYIYTREIARERERERERERYLHLYGLGPQCKHIA